MKTLLEIAFMSERTSTMDPEVRKTFSQVNKFLDNVSAQGGLSPGIAKTLSDLDDDDKEKLISVIKSLTLLTSGNVAMVRNFGKTWSEDQASDWDYILSDNSRYVLRQLGFNTDEKVSRRDYARAGAHLQRLSGESNIEFAGSRFDDPDYAEKYDDPFGAADIPAEKRAQAVARDKAAFEGDISRLYRGFHSISKELMQGFLYNAVSSWINIGRAASSSVDIDTALNFANRAAHSVLFVMSNPNKIGLDARKMSKYSHEYEIIISGGFVVRKIYMSRAGGELKPLSIDGVKLVHSNLKTKTQSGDTKNDGNYFTSVPLQKMGKYLNGSYRDELGGAQNVIFVFEGELTSDPLKTRQAQEEFETVELQETPTLTTNALKEIIQEEINAVTQEFRMPDKQFDIDVDIEPQSEPETKRIFKYTPNKQAAQAFLQQQFKIPQR